MKQSFISYDKHEDGYFLIEKLYVNPSERGSSKGYDLLDEAIIAMSKEDPAADIKLAAMADENLSCSKLVNYYRFYGFDDEDSDGAPFVVMYLTGSARKEILARAC